MAVVVAYCEREIEITVVLLLTADIAVTKFTSFAELEQLYSAFLKPNESWTFIFKRGYGIANLKQL